MEDMGTVTRLGISQGTLATTPASRTGSLERAATKPVVVAITAPVGVKELSHSAAIRPGVEAVITIGNNHAATTKDH
ncbi:hypothetical protein AN398_03295 [Corynebacterium pseudotuberculosis]|nr:hypothetical protein AN902_03310 [Corynebacterium pseudotuberculosis]ALU17233.1 hypothetical protein AN397_03305 [Corynebacterium pseudotuberculosis]ALU19226.1 hypothetical protein AK970_03305 [Corynebacterium pseudotuberculosis]ALU21215.1 hypothetical protein AN398_03295 [Corynebacterium pseudotuberculosis]